MRPFRSRVSKIRQSWRNESLDEARISRQRIAIRLTFTIITLGLIWLLAHLLFSPLFHPKTQLIYVTASMPQALDVEPIAYFRDDALKYLSAYGSFDPANASNQFFLLESPASARESLTRIAQSAEDRSDCLMIHVCAYPVVEDGVPALRCDNFNPANPAEGILRMDEICSSLADSPAGTIVLLLDVGRPAGVGSIVARDEFLTLTQQLIRSRNLPSLFIISANAPGEHSQTSLKSKGSIFLQSVVDGLHGMADLNADRLIGLDEFYQYVSSSTTSIVAQESAGKTQQTPQLIIGQSAATKEAQQQVIGSAPSRRSLIASLWSATGMSSASRSLPGATAAPEDAEEKAAAEKKSKSALTTMWEKKSEAAKDATIEQINETIDFLPSFLGNRIKRSIGTADETDESLADRTPSSTEPANASGDATADKPAGSDDTASASADAAAGGDTKEAGVADSATPSALPAGMPSLAKFGSPGQTALQLVQLAWQFTDYFENAQTVSRRPIDQAPHAWSVWLAYLHSTEQALRTGGAIDEEKLRIELTAEIVAGYQLATGQPVTFGFWMRNVANQMPAYELPPTWSISIGMAESIANSGGPALPAAIRPQVQAFDAAIAANDRTALEKWLEKSTESERQQYSEFDLAARLLASSNVPWPHIQQLLINKRQLERLAVDHVATNREVAALIQQSQRELLQAARCALDQIEPQWPDKTLAMLHQSTRTLVAAQTHCDTLVQALATRNQLMVTMPQILAWRSAAVERLGYLDVESTVNTLLTELGKLNTELQELETAQPSDIQFRTRLLMAAYRQLEAGWTQLAESLIQDSSSSAASKSWTLDTLLSNAMVRGQLRNRLITLKLEEPSSQTPVEVAPSSNVTRGMTYNLAQADDHVQRKLDLQRRWQSVLGNALSSKESSVDSIQTLSRSPLEEASQRLKRLSQVERLLCGLPIAEAMNFDARNQLSQLQQLRTLAILNLQLSLNHQAHPDALPQELALLRSQNEQLLQLSSRLTNNLGVTLDAQPAAPVVRMVARGSSQINLITNPSVNAEIRWRNAGGQLNAVWILVDYDPQLIEIEPLDNARFYRASALPKALQDAIEAAEEKLVSMVQLASAQSESAIAAAQQKLAELRACQQYPVRPLVAVMRPSTDMGAGQELTIPFQVRRIGRGADHTKIVWKVINEREYVRHEIPVALPATERLRLMVDGPRDRWSETAEGVVLHPWPNRPTEYRVGLMSDAGQARTLSVELFALQQRQELTLPEGFVDDATSQEITGRLGTMTSLANIPSLSVSADSQVNWLSLIPAGAPKVEVPMNAGAEKPKEVIQNIDVRFGLVMLLIDQESKQRMWRRIDTQVRHPRSYVTPRISYDSVAQRVRIHLKPNSNFNIAGQSIAIQGRVLSGAPAGTEMLLDGVINNEEGIELYCSLPVTAPPEMTFALDVDDFPRAFVFKVPCWRSQPDIPYQSGDQRIAIIEPLAGKALGPDADSQVVRLEVDSVAGAFASGRDAIDIGWDIDRDREFTQESTLRIQTDRDVAVSLQPPQGDRLKLDTKVTDLKISLPPPPIKNAQVNLLARLTAGGQTVWSRPVEMTVDNDPPTLASVGISPANSVAQGTDIQVRVTTDDAGLSGVETVQVVRDIKSQGKWPADAPPIVCERTADGDWLGSVPTKPLPPGRLNYLVRATDRVGNHSQLGRFTLEIFSEEQWQARVAQTGQEVSGTISYGEAPLASAKITLEDEKGKVAYTAASNAQGVFKLAKVAVGKYKLTAVGVAKNRPRISESQLEVTPPPAPPIRLRLQAK